jgi:uroporphyrinogen-III synthase
MYSPFLFKNFPDFKQNNTRIAAYGNSTLKAATDAGLKVQIKAPTPDSPSMTMAIEQYVAKQNKS